MGATGAGELALVLEPAGFNGRQLLLAETAVGATLSLVTQPSAISSTGHMFLMVIIKGNTATGTVQFTGKKADGTTAVSETTPTLAAATADKPFQLYCTSATFNTVNASAIVCTGLTNGTITVYGILAPTKLVPATFDTSSKFDQHDPADHRGIMYATFRQVQMNKHVALDKLECDCYPETTTFMGFMGFGGSPTITTIPATPTVLLAATPVSGSPLSLTTQPTAPGQLLQLVVTGTAVFGTVSVTGTNPYGQTITEIVNCYGGAGTFYTNNVFLTVNASGVATTGLTAGSLAIGGAFATQFAWNLPNATPPLIAALGIFSGTDTSAYPFTYVESMDFDMDVNKEIRLAFKAMSQDQVIIGNRQTTPMNANRLPTLGQPSDLPIVGWQALIYIDPLSGTAFSTPYNDLITCKITIPTGYTPTNTATNSQLFNRVYQDSSKIQVTFSGEIDFVDVAQYEQFRQNIKQQLGLVFRGPYVGNSPAGTLNYKTIKFNLPMKYTIFDENRNADKVTAKIEGVCEYEPSLGYAAQLTIINQSNPNYATT